MSQLGKPDPRPLLEGAELWPVTGAYAFFDAGDRPSCRGPDGMSGALGLQPVELPVAEDRSARSYVPWNGSASAIANFCLARSPIGRPTSAISEPVPTKTPVSQIATMLRCRAFFLVWWPVTEPRGASVPAPCRPSHRVPQP